jgi:putative membrane protein
MIRVNTGTGIVKKNGNRSFFRFFRRGMTLGIVLSMALYGCNDDDDDDDNAITTVQTTVIPQQTDQNFTGKSSQANRAEIELGQLAAAKATHDSVKAFAASMISEHTLAQDELKALATGKSYPFTDELDAGHLQLLNTLQNLQGAEFDRVYMDSQIADHQSVQVEYNTEIVAGNDQDIVNYANKYSPHINAHIQRAVNISNMLSEQTGTAGTTTGGTTSGTTGTTTGGTSGTTTGGTTGSTAGSTTGSGTGGTSGSTTGSGTTTGSGGTTGIQ